MTQDDTLLAAKRRRVLYRAEHRGTKEMDWLLGRFAHDTIPGMDMATLDQFEQLLALPDPDIDDWVKGATPIEPESGFADLILALRRFHGLV